jgi:glycosyltransferase involved in cell wall biosynthesis
MKNIINIGINAWVLRNKNYDGIGFFTIYTIKELCKNSPEWNFFVFVDWNYNETFFNEFKNCKVVKVFPPLRHPILYVLVLEILIPIILMLYKIDRFVGMDGMLSLISKTKQIPVIYDLNYYHYPENLPFKNRVFYNIVFKKYAKKANEIITISEFSKSDINNTYKIENSKIHVVYCGVNTEFKKIDSDEQNSIRTRYTGGNDYFTSLGSIHPRKNILNLLKAYHLFKTQTTSNTKLVLIGKFLWNNQILIDEIDKMHLRENVIFTGRLNDEETQKVLGSSKGLIFISIFEGFGIPLLEAFNADVPVICSNTTSLKEISGEAALKVDPLNIQEIASAIKELDENEQLRLELSKKGQFEKLKYNWSKTGTLMKNTISDSLKNKT